MAQFKMLITKEWEEKYADYIRSEIIGKRILYTLFSGGKASQKEILSLLESKKGELNARKLPIVSEKTIYKFFRGETAYPKSDTLHTIAIICNIEPTTISDFAELDLSNYTYYKSDDDLPKEKKTLKEKIKSKEISLWELIRGIVVLILMVFIIFAEYGRDYIKTQLYFTKKETGVLVLGFQGDKNRELQIDLVGSLYEELGDNTDIKIKSSRRKIDFDFSPQEGHKKAREIGEHRNASIVIWGNTVEKKNKIFPRITVVDEDLNTSYFIGEDFTFPFTIDKGITPPREITQTPIILAQFIRAYDLFKNEQYKSVIELIEPLLNELKEDEKRAQSLKFLTANSYLYLFDDDPDNQDLFESAKQYYDELVAADSENFSYWLRYGQLYEVTEEWEKTIECLKHIVEFQSNNGIINGTLGHLYFILGNENQALDYYLVSKSNFKKKKDFWTLFEKEGFEFLQKHGVKGNKLQLMKKKLLN